MANLLENLFETWLVNRVEQSLKISDFALNFGLKLFQHFVTLLYLLKFDFSDLFLCLNIFI